LQHCCRGNGCRYRAETLRLGEKLRRDLWQQIESGERRWTWDDAVASFTLEKLGQVSWERTERDVKGVKRVSDRRVAQRDRLRGIAQNSRDVVGELRHLPWQRLEDPKDSGITQHCNRAPWRSPAPSSSSATTTNGMFMLPQGTDHSACFQLEKVEPKGITREQAHTPSLAASPLHTRDMMIVAFGDGGSGSRTSPA